MVRLICIIGFIGCMLCQQAHATAAPLPRFVILAKDKVHMHVGPGLNFPISWIYVRSRLPLEIIGEFDHWRQMRDHQGAEGWIHKSALSSKRYVMVMHQTQPLKKDPTHDSKTIAFAETNVLGYLHECQSHWCLVSMKDQNDKVFKGWILKTALWGTYMHETKVS